MSRLFSLAVLAVAAALLTAAAASAPAGAAPTATAAKSCKVGDAQSYGTTYVLWIRARRVTCRKARERVRAFHACRRGERGRCRDLGAWTCHENRNAGAGSYDSVVRCRHNRKRVRHQYTQWT
jgi:hypothetical protein